jgi:hypothetical protein
MIEMASANGNGSTKTAETETKVLEFRTMKFSGRYSKGGLPIFNSLDDRGYHYLRTEGEPPPFIQVIITEPTQAQVETAIRQMAGLTT